MKGFYIAGGICIVVGIIVMVISFSLTGFNIRKFQTEEKLSKEMEVINEINGIGIIEFDGIDEDVEVIASDRENIQITYMDSKKGRYEIENKNGTLSIKRKKQFKWFNINIFNAFNSDSKVLIELPKKEFEELSIHLVSGDIDIREQLVKKCKVKTVSSDIKVDNHKGTSLEIISVSGDVELMNIDVIKHKYKTVSGSIEGLVAGKRKDYNFFISKVSGDSNISQSSSLGATREISVDVVSGDITFDFYEER